MREIRLRLNGFLRSLAWSGTRSRERGSAEDISLRFSDCQSLRHLAEGLGLPPTEIGQALADGRPRDLELPPPDGSLVELFPVAEPVALAGEPRFVADVHLGRLARDLRLLGFDVAWRNDLDDRQIVGLASAEGRVALTRDRGLLCRRPFAARRGDGAQPRLAGMLVRSRDPYEQLLQAFRRFGLAPLARPLSRCSACGSAIVRADKADVAHRVPRVVAERYDEFFVCPSCGKPYWKGDHFRTIAPLLERLGADLGLPGLADPRLPTSSSP